MPVYEFGPFDQPLRFHFPSGKGKQAPVATLCLLEFNSVAHQNGDVHTDIIADSATVLTPSDLLTGQYEFNPGDDFPGNGVIPSLAAFQAHYVTTTGTVFITGDGTFGASYFFNIPKMGNDFQLGSSLKIGIKAAYTSAAGEGPTSTSGTLRFRAWKDKFDASNALYSKFATNPTTGIISGVPPKAIVDKSISIGITQARPPGGQTKNLSVTNTLTYDYNKSAKFS